MLTFQFFSSYSLQGSIRGTCAGSGYVGDEQGGAGTLGGQGIFTPSSDDPLLSEILHKKQENAAFLETLSFVTVSKIFVVGLSDVSEHRPTYVYVCSFFSLSSDPQTLGGHGAGFTDGR